MIEECRVIHDFLNQLIKVGKLKQFMYQPSGLGKQSSSGLKRGMAPCPP